MQQYIDGVPDAPPIPRACGDALRCCGEMTRPPPGHGASYYFPPPWFIWSSDPSRRDRYVHNYIRIRDYTLRRHYCEDFEELSRKPEYWKEALKGIYRQISGLQQESITQGLLTMNNTLPPSISNNAEKGKHAQRKLLRAIACTEFGCNGELQPWSPDMIVTWQGKEIRYPDDISARLRQEVQYELYELNWRAELLALDLKVTKNDNNPIDHTAKRKEIVG